MKKKQISNLIWITGLSGAGKTTLAKEVVLQLRKSGSQNIIFLDGDQLRNVYEDLVDKNYSYDKQSRISLALSYAKLCQSLVSQGFTVVIATISLYNTVHTWNRKNQTGYFEIYLKVPLSELVKRDPKGIYKKFYSGSLRNLAGLDLEIDEPKAPDLVLDYDPNVSVLKMARQIIDSLGKLQ